VPDIAALHDDQPAVGFDLDRDAVAGSVSLDRLHEDSPAVKHAVPFIPQADNKFPP
jgi:hypothetical protein